MAKLSGVNSKEFKLGTNSNYTGNEDIRSDVMSYEINATRDTQEVQGLDVGMKEYLNTLKDFEITGEGTVNSNADSLFRQCVTWGDTEEKYVSVSLDNVSGTLTGVMLRMKCILSTFSISVSDGNMSFKFAFKPAQASGATWV